MNDLTVGDVLWAFFRPLVALGVLFVGAAWAAHVLQGKNR